MKGIVVEITFPEAIFVTHYSKGFRDTYLIPLPTSVAGMFGAMLGISRKDIPQNFSNFYFGAKLKIYKGIINELFTYVNYKGKEAKWGVAKQTILNNPTYEIVIAGNDNLIDYIYQQINDGIVYLPYGGYNDYPAEDFKVLEMYNVNETTIITNYAPRKLVNNVFIDKKGEFQKAIVKTRSEAEEYYFVYNGRVELNTKIYALKDIGIFRLDNYLYLTR